MEEIMPKTKVHISLSVVSHGQMDLVQHLLLDLDKVCHSFTFEVLLTLNLPETVSFTAADFHYPLHVLHNVQPQGFASNHNQAFEQATGQYFCVLNPDIRLQMDPFPALLASLSEAGIGVSAPVVRNPAGTLEDSFRRFPTPLSIFCKALGCSKGTLGPIAGDTIYPDWAGGMFLLFPKSTFQRVRGFDPRYFLYYEDVDICARLRLAGFRVAVTPLAQVVHAAQRTSHVQWKYRRWHLASMARFFLSPAFFRHLWSRRDAKHGGVL